MNEIDVELTVRSEDGLVHLHWQDDWDAHTLELSDEEVRRINKVAFADRLETAAKRMHEWSQQDEQKKYPWGEEGCGLCRRRVKNIIDLLHGEEL